MSESFVLELPLQVSSGEEKILEGRFEAGRHLYNACLSEELRSLSLLRESKEFARARSLPKGQERTRAFRELEKRFGFTDYDLQSFATRTKNTCFIGEHLDAHACQKIATRGYLAVRRYALGKGGRPRFRSRFRTLDSVEGKSNAAGIRWRNDRVLWNGLELLPLFDKKDKHGVQTLALQCQVKYVRLIRRTVRGRQRWYVQLVMNGLPKWKDKNPLREGIVGLDLGPSSLAAVSETEARLEVFCPSVSFLSGKIRRVQRAMDRSRRATNPENYHPDGTVKKGPKRWVLSTGYLRLRGELKELHRKLAASRKTEQGTLVNRIVALGKTVRTEKLSYKAFQKNFGRSVRDRAPGMFVSLLHRKAERAGGQVIEFPTRTTKLSQACHCGRFEKKPLNRRWHRCPCGIGPVQRDLYSAFLARHVAGETLDIRQAQQAWPGAESLLSEAISRVKHQAAKGWIFPSSFGLGQRQSGSSP